MATVHHFQRFLDSTANWTYFKSLRGGFRLTHPNRENCMVATAQVCFRDVLYPSWVKRSSVLTAHCCWGSPRLSHLPEAAYFTDMVWNRALGGGGGTQSTPPLPICHTDPLLFFASLTLRIWFLFLKGRSNTLTGFPYRITSLLCSHFREISSQVQWHCVY